MGRFFSGFSTLSAPRRIRGEGVDPFDRAFVPAAWVAQAMAAMGGVMTPEVLLTLSAVYSGVTMIAEDIASFPCITYRYLDNGGKQRARNHPLFDLLRWQPNRDQTAVEFWSMMIGQMLLRGNAYAEIIAGPRGFADQLVPIHNDRLTVEKLENGRRRYVVRDEMGTPRKLTQDEVFSFADFSIGGLQALSRFAYGLRSLTTAITQEQFTLNFFKKGATGGLVAIHKGGALDDDEQKALHASISMYIAGAENAGGLLVIEDDVDLKTISQDLDKAQLTELKQQAIHDVERWLRMPSGRLGASDQTHADAAVVQSNLQYGTVTLRPICVRIEQSIRRDLILAPDTYFSEFLMDALQRADTKTRYETYEIAMRNRMMWPSEGRILENMNPDDELDELFKRDRQPGQPAQGKTEPPKQAAVTSAAPSVRAALLAYDTAQRVVRREIAGVMKLAERHSRDQAAFVASLEGFYVEHTKLVAETMRLPRAAAARYTDAHKQALIARHIEALADWEQIDSEQLATLALSADQEMAVHG